ncbi:MAG: ATP-binding protein, partial [Nitrosomonadales bacterium]
ELVYQNEEKEKRAAELVIANVELVYQNEEKEKRAAELVIANVELVYQNEEKEKRAAELVIANVELVYQNEEKEKRAAELVITNVELIFQNQEKEKRAAELVIANVELVFQNKEKGKRAAELVIALNSVQEDDEDKNALFVMNPNAIVVIDNNGKISGINPAFGQIFNVDESTLIGVTQLEFDCFIHEKCTHQDRYLATSSLPLNANLKAKQSVSAAKTDKLDFEINLDGIKFISRSYIDCNITRISRIIHFQDITERTLIDRMKSEFIATAAHELRTPMTTIFGYAELLKEMPLLADAKNEMISTIHDQSILMINLLNEILDMAKMEANAANLYQIKRQPIGPILALLTNTFITPGNHNKVVFDLSPNLPDINIDKTKVEQVVRNILSNAYKFSPNNDVITMRVSEIMHDERAMILITIQDRGIGMKPAEQKRIFEKFYRADQSGKVPGTGLGMAIVNDIIKYHDGSIEIESEYGVGTKVKIYLPIAQ